MFNLFRKRKPVDRSKEPEKSSQKPLDAQSKNPQDSKPHIPHPSNKTLHSFEVHDKEVHELPHHLEVPPPPEESLIENKPYDVELVKLPGEKSDLKDSLLATYNLIKAKAFDQAGMLYDVIDPEFKKQNPKDADLRNLYNEVTAYIWINDAFKLAMKRQHKSLPNLIKLINTLMSRIKPRDSRVFFAAKSQLAYIESLRRKP